MQQDKAHELSALKYPHSFMMHRFHALYHVVVMYFMITAPQPPQPCIFYVMYQEEYEDGDTYIILCMRTISHVCWILRPSLYGFGTDITTAFCVLGKYHI